MSTQEQDYSFANIMSLSITSSGYISTNSLNNAIDWMRRNLEPEDIFSEKQLSNWAEANGYIKE